MAIKRNREEMIDFESSIAMANYLILLSSGGPGLSLTTTTGSSARSSTPARVFECKTCNRKFPSFQALGGHRASHKKPRSGPGPDTASDDHHHSHDDSNNNNNLTGQKPNKAAHECSVCGLEFAIGQALGGHMRRHRAALTGSIPPALSLSLGATTSDHVSSCDEKLSGVSKSMKINGSDDLDQDDHDHKKGVKCMDLNLTPLENGLLLEIGMVSPIFC